MKKLVAAAALAAAQVNAQDLCSSGASMLTLEQTNRWCEVMNEGTAMVEAPQCCSGGSSASRRLYEALAAPSTPSAPRALQTDDMRGIETSAAYCDTSVNSRCESYLGDGDSLTVSLEMSNLADSGACCQTCTCYGDPECVSFSGVKDEWILCDGRNNNTCVVTEYKCKNKKDHAGNQCSYIKDDPTKWTSFEESGSPCQPDWEVSGYPEMLMYGTGSFKSVLRLGERGVIRDVIIQQSGKNSNRTLNADTCFEKVNAWTGGSIPSSWKRTTQEFEGKTAEVTWTIVDEETGIHMVIACTSAIDSLKHRIDVRSLIEVDETRISNSAGVCMTGDILEKGGPRLKEKYMHQRCLALNIPTLLVACKALVDEQCQDYTLTENIEKWCEHADLARVSSTSSVEDCKTKLLSGSNQERVGLWTEMVCEINQDNIDACTAQVSQFGWFEYLATKSNGADFGELNQPGQPSCVSDPSTYTTNSDECAEGVSVQYLDGEWKELFFIPALQPPCGDEMTFTAAQAPELFKHKIRFVQNDLNAVCLVENECRATQELKVAVNFDTEVCPCANPISEGEQDGTADLVGKYSVASVFEIDELTCSGSDTNLFQIGCGSGLNEQPVKVNVKDCSTDIEVLVSIEGQDTPLTCLIDSGIELKKEYTLVFDVNENDMYVSIDGEVVCQEDFTGVPKGSFGECVYRSAPRVPAANACATVYVQNEVCENVLTPGKMETEAITGTNGYTIQVAMEPEYFVCGKGKTNIMKVGCEEEETIVSLDLKDCSGDAVATVGLPNGKSWTCQMPDAFTVGSDSVVQVTVDGDAGEASVVVNGETVCTKSITGFVPIEETCMYTSAPNAEPAYACNIVSSITGLTVGGPCATTCTPGAVQPKICDGNQEVVLMGECEECCPENSTIYGTREPVCRDVSINQPFCDTSVNAESDMCKKLKKNNAEAQLTLFVNLDYSSETTCCENCVCYGDPECQAFDGSEDKWILCDGRGSDCVVDEGICVNQKDHGGNACVYHPDIFEKIEGKRADIGAYGSPCLPDWENSGAAFMTMYKVDNFEARISMGERGVIETLELNLAAGSYTLVADECFEGNSWDSAWETSSGAKAINQALNVDMSAGPGQNERTMEITDPVSGIFIRAVCIKQTSSDGAKTSYRMNINNLVETDTDRAMAASADSNSGYCAQKNSVIDTLQSDRRNSDEIYETCLMDLADAHLFCKQVWNPSCTAAQVPLGVERWCQSANIFPTNPNRVQKCIDYIGTSAARWEELYCEAVSSQRPPSMSVSAWKKTCVATLETDGYFKTVDEYGKGTFTDNGRQYCASTVDVYGPKQDDCVPGIKVESQNKKGEWVEEFYIPSTLPPCEGQLKVSASSNYNLFTRPIRFTQCEVDADKCSTDLGCLPMYQLNMEYQFTYDNDFVCPNRLL